MLDSASHLPLSLQSATVGVPYQVVVDDEKKTKNSVEEMVMGSNLRFPVIAKPLYADGTMKSHELCLVFDAQGLRETLNKNAGGGAATTVVLQEFVNHGGAVFKVYVAGEHVR
ncbi:Inositol-tetrakisphosphate 1-kinase [Arachis hypogaea]|nr:Inositol-tetrakisphosphate 1-kinase [Arachis hypogaea]